jgi:hypothetical protein
VGLPVRPLRVRPLRVRLETLRGLRLRLGLRRLLRVLGPLSLVLDRIVELGAFTGFFPRDFTSSPTAPMMLFSSQLLGIVGG